MVSIMTVLGLGVALGATYAHVLDRHVGLWDRAYAAEVVATERIKASIPNLPEGSTLLTSSYPAYETLGVPIFSSPWDLDGRIKLLYDDGTLRAYPITEEIQPGCLVNGVGFPGRAEELPTAPYGTAWLLNLETGQRSVPKDRQDCEAVIAEYPPGPLYNNYSY
jgi:hypothetical protein